STRGAHPAGGAGAGAPTRGGPAAARAPPRRDDASRRRGAGDGCRSGADVGSLNASFRAPTSRSTTRSASRSRSSAGRSPGSRFVDFAPAFLGLELTEAQAAITSVLFDGCAPPPKYVDSIFGGLRTAPDPSALVTVEHVGGRGGGKSRVLIAGRAL